MIHDTQIPITIREIEAILAVPDDQINYMPTASFGVYFDGALQR
jgi:hypothetical protein